jgi:hypothetical protein
VVLNHFVAEYATLISEPPPQYIYDWQDPDNRHHIVLPYWETSLRITQSKTSSTLLFQNKSAVFDLIQRVEAIHYIDGHRFPTNPIVIEHFTSLLKTSSDQKQTQKPNETKTSHSSHFKETNGKSEERNAQSHPHTHLFIHCTPRQIKDSKRQWIAQEHSVFKEELLKRNVSFFDKIYFDNEQPSLENHFKILKVFETNF